MYIPVSYAWYSIYTQILIGYLNAINNVVYVYPMVCNRDAIYTSPSGLLHWKDKPSKEPSSGRNYMTLCLKTSLDGTT